jgi:hypothetical protein
MILSQDATRKERVKSSIRLFLLPVRQLLKFLGAAHPVGRYGLWK